ncbi:uncharacterized protein LOC125557545 [Nematostella vectensis]|uniref:uncharacterized protein LOC125557545 n=1 Tax=Nematostella vectensis TaxID=45351 RepID=UPI002076FB71|nr:uncharacterized protein LOC125557545 [Nematostella vectensis]
MKIGRGGEEQKGVVEPISQTDPVTFTKPGPAPGTSMAPSTAEDNTEFLLSDGWRQTLPKEDHKWIARSLFKVNASSGKAELDFTRADKLWCYPPQPQFISSQPPNPDYYFVQPLLLWVPHKLWKVVLKYHEERCNHNLRSVVLKAEITSSFRSIRLQGGRPC